MIITLIRAVVLYFTVMVAMRVMGKRQIGELQPGELVITILISECAAAPIQDINRPVITGIISIFVLVILEIALSYCTMKFPRLRKIVDGSPAVVILDGVIQQTVMEKLRLTVDDLTNTLRQNGYFNLSDVSYCIVETDGNLSIFPTPSATPATAKTLGKNPPNTGIPCVLVGDGRIHHQSLTLCGMDEAALYRILKKENTPLSDVFVLWADRSGQYSLVKKENRS